MTDEELKAMKARRATAADLLPDRTAMHKYMAKPDSCGECGGRGWCLDAEGVEWFCDCAAGSQRREVEHD